MCRRSKVSALTKLTLCSRATQWPNRILPIYKFSENIFAIVRIRNVFHWLYSLALRPLKTYTNCRCSIWIQPTVWIMQYCFFISSLWRWQSLYFLLLFYTQKTFHFAKLKAQISIFTYSKFRKNSTLLCVFFSLSLSLTATLQNLSMFLFDLSAFH